MVLFYKKEQNAQKICRIQGFIDINHKRLLASHCNDYRW